MKLIPLTKVGDFVSSISGLPLTFHSMTPDKGLNPRYTHWSWQPHLLNTFSVLKILGFQDGFLTPRTPLSVLRRRVRLHRTRYIFRHRTRDFTPKTFSGQVLMDGPIKLDLTKSSFPPPITWPLFRLCFEFCWSKSWTREFRYHSWLFHRSPWLQ